MKVAVLGAGAVGSMLGGLIQHFAPAVDVLLIARGVHGEAMRRQGGVTLTGAWGTIHVPLAISTEPKDLEGADYVLLTVKSYATEEAMRLAADHIQQATVVSIQNGVNQRILSRYVSPERLVMGMTATNTAVTTPGTVAMQRSDATVIGPALAHDAMGLVEDAASLLRHSGLKIVTDPNVIGAQYNKLIFNTLGSAASLSASDFLGEAVLFGPWRNEVAIPLQRESLEVLARCGIRLGRIPGAADAIRFGRLLRVLNWPLAGRLVELVVRKFFNRQPIRFSLGIDLGRGKATEVDFINGEIVRLARQCGAAAPLNAKVVEMVHRVERDGSFLKRDEVITALSESERAMGRS